MSQLKDIPALQSDGKNLPAVVAAIREAIQTFRGYRGDSLDKALTGRDFKSGELRTLLQGIAGGSTVVVGGGGSGGGGATPDTTPPPTPTGFAVSAGVAHVYIEHEAPAYTQGHGHDRTLVYGAQWSASDPTPPTFSEAVPLMHFQGNFGAFPADPGVRWKLWIKWQSVDGVPSTDPAGGTNGQEATTAYDTAVVLSSLTGLITASQLYGDLATTIGLVTASDTTAGSVNARIKAETDARTAALVGEASARTSALAAEASARAAAIGSETTARIAAVSQEQSDRADAIAAVESTLSDDISDAVAHTDSTATALRAEFAAADATTLAAAESFTYSRATIDAADAATLTTLRAEFAAADGDTLADAQAYVQGYGYSFATANAAIADAVNTVSARLNVGGDVYSSIASTQTKVDAKSANFVQGTAPTNPSNGLALRTSDLWIDTGNGNKLKRWSGGAWIDADDTRIGTTASQVTTLTSQVGNKNKVFRQSTAPTATAVNDLWIDTANGNITKAWNGSSWVAVDDARLASTKALLLSDYTTTVGMNSAIASATTSLRSEFQSADNAITADLATNYYTKTAADSAISTSTNTLAAQLRGSYTGADLGSVSSGLLYQERQARISLGDALSQQITLLSAGSGEQFDYGEIWYFDAGVDGWSAAPSITMSQVDGWLRAVSASGTVASPYLRSPDNIGLQGSKYTQVRARLRKIGTPSWTGKVWFNTTTDATFDAAKSIAIAAPSFDANGISVVTWDMPSTWTAATIRQVFIEPGPITPTSYYELDWVAIGRPSPGASSAQLAELQQAITDGDSAGATATETLAAQVRGTYSGSDIALAGGLFASERAVRSAADTAEVAARQSLSTKITGVADPSSLTLSTLAAGLLYDERQARSTADGAQVTRLDSLEATVNNPATGVTATAGGLSSLTAAVNNGTTGLSATVTRVNSLEAQVGDPTTGLLVTAAALDVLEAEVHEGSTGLSATLSRVVSLESKVDSPGTGLLARASVLESTVTNAVSGNSALATRALSLEARVNSPTATPGTTGYNPTYAALQTETQARSDADGTLFAQYTVKVDVNGYVSGFGLASTAVTAVPTSSFIVRADKFAVSSPSGPGVSPVTPFVVNTTAQVENGVTVPPGVYMDGAYIRNLTAAIARMGSAWIDDAKIANLSAAKLTAGTGVIGGPLKSSNYSAGTAGWLLQPNGTAQLPAASIIGLLTAAQINGNGLNIATAGGTPILTVGSTAGASTFAGNVTGNVAGTSAATLLSTANTASTNAASALSLLTDIASDSKLTPVEKSDVRKEWDTIYNERSGIVAQATAMGIGAEQTAYLDAMEDLGAYLNGGGAYTPNATPPSWITDANLSATTTISPTIFRASWASFYAARQALLNKIAAVAATTATTGGLSGSLGINNLVSNSSFEKVVTGGPRPAGWAEYAFSFPTAPWFRVTGRTGSGYAFALKALGSYTVAPYGFGLMHTDDTSPVSSGRVRGGWIAGKTYMVSFYAKKVNGAGMGAMRLNWNHPPKTTTHVSNPALTTAWQRYAFKITWGSGANVDGERIEGGGGLYISVEWPAAVVANDEIHIDDLLIVEGEFLPEWSDGFGGDPNATYGVAPARQVLAGEAGLAVGSLEWDSAGNRTAGNGLGLTAKGLVAYNSGGTATFVLDGATGSATFAGALAAATGTFAGSLSAATGTFAGALSAATGTFAGTLTAAAVNAVNTINIAGNAVSVPVAASVNFWTVASLTIVVTSNDLPPSSSTVPVVVIAAQDTTASTNFDVSLNPADYLSAGNLTASQPAAGAGAVIHLLNLPVGTHTIAVFNHGTAPQYDGQTKTRTIVAMMAKR